MHARAIAKYIRISPKKTRIVADVVRGKNVDEALALLISINKKAGYLISDVVESAANNAKRKSPEQKIENGDLYISKITIDEGPALTRFRAASMGRASMIKRRTSHITCELNLIPGRVEKKEKPAKAKKVKPKEPVRAKGGSK